VNFDLIARQSAEDLEKLARFEKAKAFAVASIPTLAAILGTTAFFAGTGYYKAKKALEAQREALADSHGALSKHEAFKGSPNSFNQRFSELSVIAPAIAANPALAKKVLEPRLEKGFDLDDIHRLSAIEYHSGHAPKLPDPQSVAKNQAVVGLGRALNYIIPSIPLQHSINAMAQKMPGKDQPKNPLTEDQAKLLVNLDANMQHYDPRSRAQELREAYAQHAPTLSNPHDEAALRNQVHAEAMASFAETRDFVRAAGPILKEHGTEEQNKSFEHWKQSVADFARENLKSADTLLNLKKEGSDMSDKKISDECLGRMLAETHLMCKQAGIVGSIGDTLKASGNHLLDYAKLMSVPLALAVGMGVLKSQNDARKKAALHAEADKVFAKLQRTSDAIQANPEIAGQAFDTLKSFAPALAAKPIIVKTFVENVVNGQGHLDPSTANMLATTQQTVQTIEKQPGFLAGLKEPLSLFTQKVPKIEHERSAKATGVFSTKKNPYGI
jgi:hypothetical protein